MLHANQSINNGAVVTVSNPNAGSLAYANVNVNNDSGTGVNLFINSSARATDGGVNGATLRNDIGDLRLQGLGGFNTNIGITVKGTTGNVGIGTSAPVTRLDVTGDITQSPALRRASERALSLITTNPRCSSSLHLETPALVAPLR